MSANNTTHPKQLPIKIYLGGSFDPIHNSHIAMLKHVYQTLAKLSSPQPLSTNIQAYLLPTSRSPLKDQSTQPQHRLAMLNLATSSLVNNSLTANASITARQLEESSPFSVCEYEIWQEPPTYTIDTLIYLRKTYPNTSLVFIIGADNVASLAKWRDADKLINYAHLWVIPRDEFQSKQDITALLPNSLKPHVVSLFSDLQYAKHGFIYIDSYIVKPISSSAIREAIEQGNAYITKSALPHSVYSYIIKNNLYHPKLS